jgi:hypothetical protein
VLIQTIPLLKLQHSGFDHLAENLPVQQLLLAAEDNSAIECSDLRANTLTCNIQNLALTLSILHRVKQGRPFADEQGSEQMLRATAGEIGSPRFSKRAIFSTVCVYKLIPDPVQVSNFQSRNF